MDLTRFCPVLLFLAAAVCFFCVAAHEDQAEQGVNSVKVGSFNLQVFGVAKFSKQDVVSQLVQIVLGYDIILLMEIRDKKQTVIHSLLKKVNSAAPSGVTYDLKLSERLGRGSNKEQYAYFYRTDHIKILKTYQFEDEEDVFEREPYGVLVSTIYPDVPEFFLVGLHADSKSVVLELNLMDDVYDQASKHFGTKSGILLGDFNADCKLLSRKEEANLDLVKNKHFNWLIGIDEDTTSKTTSCAYDRIVSAGDVTRFIPRSEVEIFRFDQEFGLTPEQVKAVSDHYPIGCRVQGKEVDEEEEQQKILARRRKIAKRDVNTFTGLSLAAFNIRVFGTSKFENDAVVDILSRIVRRYDLVLIQELRDSTETVIYDFLSRVNRDAAVDGVTYALVISKRLGRTASKEQYTYMYRIDAVELNASLQYDDPQDVFEREPFSVKVRSLRFDIPEFFLVGLHSRPSDVMAELNQLDEVFNQAEEFFGTSNGIILGDLNADCSYLSRTRYNQLDLVTDPRFSWLINSSVDTTVSASHCAYDRFIVAGEIGNYIVPNSAGIFRFDQAYGLNNELTEDVSDHYPIECELQGNPLVMNSETLAATATGGAQSPHCLHHTSITSLLTTLLVFITYISNTLEHIT